jgi:hypothetical protein
MAIPFQTSQVVTAIEMNELARAHWRKTTAKTVVNTITETDLLNGEFTIDAGAMSTNRMLRLTASGDWINNTGAAVATPRLKLKFGATTVVDSNVLAAAWAAHADRRGWRLIAEIANLGAANAQLVTINMDAYGAVGGTSAAAGFTIGEGVITTATGISTFKMIGASSGAVDTTTAQTLVLTVTLATANALEDMKLSYAAVELV